MPWPLSLSGAACPMGEQPAKTLNVWTLVGIGGYNAGCLLAGFVLGWFGEERLETTPVLTLVGLACGIVIGVVGTWLRVRGFLREWRTERLSRGRGLRAGPSPG